MDSSKLQETRVRIHRALKTLALLLTVFAVAVGCSTLPTPAVKRYLFPERYAFVGVPEREFEKLGGVRSKATWPSLNMNLSEAELCRNAFNEAAIELVKIAQKNGADAVIDVRSVVVLMDGRTETHDRPECSDDGQEGEVLLQGVAIKWKKLKKTATSKVGPG